MEELFKLIIPLALLAIGFLTRPKKQDLEEGGTSSSHGPVQEPVEEPVDAETQSAANEARRQRMQVDSDERIVSYEQIQPFAGGGTQQSGRESNGASQTDAAYRQTQRERSAMSDSPDNFSGRAQQQDTWGSAWEESPGPPQHKPAWEEKQWESRGGWENDWKQQPDSWHEESTKKRHSGYFEGYEKKQQHAASADGSGYGGYPSYPGYRRYPSFPKAAPARPPARQRVTYTIDSPAELTQAIVWSEIVGTPVALRRHPEPHRQW
jgi:hypothetical protein